MKLMSLIIFLFVCKNAQSSNILGIFQVPSYSHQILPQKILRELSVRGHNLTIFSTGLMNFDGLSNVTQHIFTESVESYEKYSNIMQVKREGMNEFLFYASQMKAYCDLTVNQLKHPKLLQLMESEQKFDLIITECYLCPYRILSEIFQCPIITLHSADVPSILLEIYGNEKNPSKYSEQLLPYFPRHLSSLQKLPPWFWFLGLKVGANFFSRYLNKNLGLKFFDARNLGKTDFQLINTNPHFGHARAIMPNTKQIGFAHVDPPKLLDDQELKEFLDASDSVIISFGSSAKTSHLGLETIKKFLKVFSNLSSLNFVWKFEEKIENLPKNVKTFQWLKLADVLAHPNVKLFVTHGGINSAYEAIDREVPMIVFPLAWDQGKNAKMMIANGIAVEVDLNSFTAEELEVQISKALNGTFMENVRKLKKIVNDVPMKPFDVAMESIEFVLRNPKNKKDSLKCNGESFFVNLKESQNFDMCFP